jgi:hypothetical protein
MTSVKPSWSRPSRFSSGTQAPSNATSAVSEACQPSLCSGEAVIASCRGTMRKLSPWWPPSGRVRTAVT